MMILAAALGCALAAGPAPAPGPDPLIAALQKKLDSLQTLTGRFTQNLESTTLGRSRVEAGSFYLKRPGLMRWEYETPERKLAIVDGEHTWLYLPEDGEVYRGSAARLKEAGAAALLLTGGARLTSAYSSRRVPLSSIPATGAAGTVAVELKPLQPSEDAVMLVLAIEPEKLEIRMLVVSGEMQDRIIYRFHDLRENIAVDAAQFRFTPPPGVEIVDDP